MKEGRSLVVLDRRASTLSNEEDVLFSRNDEAWVITACDARTFRRNSKLGRLSKKGEHSLLLDDHLSSCNVAHVGNCRAGSQEILGYHVLHDVRYAQIDKPYATVFFERL